MLITKSLHIFFVISWFACLLYLPRLFVNHAQCSSNEQKQLLLGMQERLIKMMNFTSAGTFISAIVLVFIISGGTNFNHAYLVQNWLLLKIALVFGLLFFQYACLRIHKNFADETNNKSHIWFRWFNEIPAIILLPIIYLVVAKPF